MHANQVKIQYLKFFQTYVVSQNLAKCDHNFHYQAGKGGELTYDETTIISGALDLTQKTAKDAMTPLNGVFSLDLNAKLDKQAT